MLTPAESATITSDTKLAPGIHYLPGGLTIAADGVTLDGNGALLVGAGRQGRGISVEGRAGIAGCRYH